MITLNIQTQGGEFITATPSTDKPPRLLFASTLQNPRYPHAMKTAQFLIILAAVLLIAAGVWYPVAQKAGKDVVAHFAEEKEQRREFYDMLWQMNIFCSSKKDQRLVDSRRLAELSKTCGEFLAKLHDQKEVVFLTACRNAILDASEALQEDPKTEEEAAALVKRVSADSDLLRAANTHAAMHYAR